MKPIFVTTWGSNLYGLNKPNSDLDIRGVYLPEVNELLGLKDYSGVIDFKEQFEKDHSVSPDIPIDAKLYSLKHFLNQIAKGSPNAVELLFTEYHLWSSYPPWQHIVNEQLISQETVKTFLATAKRLTNNAIKNKDDKEMMHAYRILIQAEMLARTGRIDYPFNYYQINFLKRIRSGIYKADHMGDILYQCEMIGKMNNMLPEKTNHDKIDEICRMIHLEYIRGNDK